MSRSYTDIESTLTSFASAYSELRSLSNDLTTVLKGRLLMIGDDELKEITESLIDDPSYIVSLSKAIRGRDAMSALRIYAEVIRRLTESIEKSERVKEKLSERIQLSGECHEKDVAIRKRSVVNQNISIYNERKKYCIEKFYGLRKNMLSRIAKMSLAITTILPNDNTRLRAVKYAPVCVDELASCDKCKEEQ